MKARIEPGTVSGSLTVPPSKSYSQRALAAALLRKGETTITNFGSSDDELAALSCIEALGAEIEKLNETLIIRSTGIHPKRNILDCGESGLCARLFLPIAALSDQPLMVTGHGSLLNRPMISFLHILPSLDVEISHTDGSLPITLKGPMVPARIHMDGRDSSQFLSGMLFAFAAACTKPTTIHVKGLVSKGYADITLEILETFGFEASKNGNELFEVRPVTTQKPIISYDLKGDWSSAAAWLLAGTLSGEIHLSGLVKDSLQPDAKLFEILQNSGGALGWKEDQLFIKRAAIKPFSFDATDSPDLFPLLTILAASIKGESRIEGLHRLTQKESNRDESIRSMLTTFGVKHRVEETALIIEGNGIINGGVIPSFNDHRIVMAASVAALIAKEPVVIEDAEAVSKSYPAFFDHLRSLGVTVSLT